MNTESDTSFVKLCACLTWISSFFLLLNIFRLLFILSVTVSCLHVSLCSSWCQRWSQFMWGPQELQLQGVMSHYVRSGNKHGSSAGATLAFYHSFNSSAPRSPFHEEKTASQIKKVLGQQRINYLLSRTWSNASDYFSQSSKCQLFITISSWLILWL